jgi:Cof subfamily protein (haloacid dehalogenase superfamily)
MCRLIASDIDGTLTYATNQVSDRTVAALAAAEAAGITVVLCTGRPTRWMTDFAERTGHHGIAVCANGAVVYDLHTETILESFELEPAIARRLVEAIRAELPESQFAVERAGGMTHEPSYVPRYPLPDHVVAVDVDTLVAEPMFKLLVKHPELSSSELHEVAHRAVADLAEIATATYAGSVMLEISAAGISKAYALERLAAERGIDAADVVAFGDMPNDIPMLTWAGRGIAVANAHPDVLAIADEVTLGGDEDGVAIVIERLLAT